MSSSTSALSALQKAGMAISEADAELKNAVNEYALRVNAAIASSPYNQEIDALFDHWKVMARLSQSMTGIEEELRKVSQSVSALMTNDQPVLEQVIPVVTTADVTEPVAARPIDTEPTDAVIKKHKKTLPPVGNAAKLLKSLENLLTTKSFTLISQTQVSHETGIPLGSMTAALKQLIQNGRITVGPTGGYKLAKFR